VPIPEASQNQEFDRLLQRLRHHVDRRGLGRLAAGALGAASTLHLLDNAEAKKKKKKKRKKHNGSGSGSPAGTPGGTPAQGTTASPTYPPGTLLSQYDITLTGTVGSRTFQRAGILAFRQPFDPSGTQNGANPFDVCLKSGDPATNPSVGAIQLSSNNACFGGRSGLDLAYVTITSATQLVVEPDSRLAATCNNIYNYSSGLTAAVYAPYDGSMVINLLANGDQVAGTIDTNGLIYCQSPGVERYRAQFAGHRR
jgi:hypothetical protein